MKTIAIIACCDTKYHEIAFARERIEKAGHEALVVDISTGPILPMEGDVRRETVLEAGGFSWNEVKSFSKSEAIDAMAKSIAVALPRLAREKRIHGVLGMGGLQNAVICSAAFRKLPMGFPKLIVSTVASGYRYFDMLVGDRDITTVPSIVDFTGINPISKTILGNAVAGVIGMVEHGGEPIDTEGHFLIATTLMGITNDTVMNAVDQLERLGRETISFHSTGIGGRVMEEMIRQGHIRAVMDLTLHEMTAEYLGGYGYSKGANGRLNAAAERGIPMLVCPGGIDFLCLSKEDFLADQEERGYVWHNSDLTHTRLHEREILEITDTIIHRVNQSRGRVTVLLPLGGLRTLSGPGEPFHKPEIIRKMRERFKRGLNGSIRFVCEETGFNDPAFADAIVREMLLLLEGEHEHV